MLLVGGDQKDVGAGHRQAQESRLIKRRWLSFLLSRSKNSLKQCRGGTGTSTRQLTSHHESAEVRGGVLTIPIGQGGSGVIDPTR